MPLRSRVAWLLVVAALTMVLTPRAGAQTRAAGELVWAWHVTIAPSWFDPGEVPAQITPFSLIYAMHDAVVRAMPGERMGNSLAESWSESPDGLGYEFKLRQSLRFHNGDPCTADDVKFTFERSKGAGASVRPSYTRSNGSPSSGRCLPRSWTCEGSRVWGHA